MKTLKKFIGAGLMLCTLGLQAQTVDEVVAKANKAMGGVEKIKTLISVKRTGSLSSQGMDIPMVFTVAHMKGMRVDFEVMGTSNYQIMTPDKGFNFYPIQQMTEPKELDADAVKAGQGGLDLHGVFVDSKAKEITIEYVGKDKVDGAEADKLKVVRKSGKETFYFVDSKTGFVLKTTRKATAPDGTEVDDETVFSNYKQNADGYWFAYGITSSRGPITFDTIESNVKVDESIFKN
jgi:hypothetical protein